MKDFFRQMFSAENGQISSKRVMGVLMCLAILFDYVYCAIAEKAMPDGTGELLLASSALLGVDSVTSVFKQRNNEKSTD